ncbi:MAG: hypothetical protein KBC57_03395 [Neisseriaceae bacterium]|nr:hypothetical protein [Neisseriaceae bacterium]
MKERTLTWRGVAEVWATVDGKPMSRTSIWRYEQKGLIPKPLPFKVRGENQYLEKQVLALHALHTKQCDA